LTATGDNQDGKKQNTTDCNHGACHEKPKKDTCVRHIIDLINGEELTDQNLAELYKFFMPPIPKAKKTPEQWVATAIGDKDVRFYLNYVYVDKEWVIGSNGHHLHRVHNDNNLEPGYYLPSPAGGQGIVLAEPPDFATYPQVESVIPASKKGGVKFTVDDLEINKEQLAAGSSKMVDVYKFPKRLIGDERISINYGYLNDLIAIPGFDDAELCVYPKKGYVALWSGKLCLGVIMLRRPAG